MRLNSLTKKANKDLKEPIALFLSVDTMQQISEKGLEFSIKVINNSNKDIKIKNPLDFLQVMLFNESGYNITVPQVQRVKINSVRNIQYKTFILKEVFLNKEALTLDSLLKEEFITPVKSSYTISLKIENVLATENGKPLLYSKRVKLSSGKYKFGITLSLIGEGIESLLFQTVPIIINYN